MQKFPITFVVILVLLASLTGVSAQESDSFPVVIDNCGVEITYDAAPEKAVTMNQSATEIMLALGLEDKMVGTAYMDDVILPEFEEVYNTIPVLAEGYPSQEVLFGVDPDFVYGSYSSAFGEEAAGPRESLLELNIGSYVSPVACSDRALRPEVTTIDDVFGEILDIGRIFGVEDRAEALVAELQAELDLINQALAEVEEPLRVFWYDSGSDNALVGACCGAPGMIMNLLGVENVFSDLDGSWASASWEEVVARNPEVIVLVHASWDTAEEKIENLTSNPAYADIIAVQNESWVEIDFSYTSPNIRNVAAVRILAEALYPDLMAAVSVEATPEAVAETNG